MKGWLLVVWVATGLTGTARTAGAQPGVNLDLRNVAEVAETVLAEAKKTMTRIYEEAGITVQWNAPGSCFTIVVSAQPHPAAVRVLPFALGYAPRTTAERGRRVYILADRVEGVARSVGVPHHVVLGMVMAHELGHVLLPDNSHSRSGIMRNDWTQSDYLKAKLGLLNFTTEQAQLMRDEIATSASR